MSEEEIWYNENFANDWELIIQIEGIYLSWICPTDFKKFNPVKF